MKIQTGDTVVVIKGSDKKKSGTVLRVLQEEDRVLVSGVNVRTIHRKPRTRDEKGTREKKERPINISNVAVVDPKTKKPTRISFTGVGKDKRRIARKSGTVLDAKKKRSAHKTGVLTKAEGGKESQEKDSTS